MCEPEAQAASSVFYELFCSAVDAIPCCTQPVSGLLFAEKLLKLELVSLKELIDGWGALEPAMLQGGCFAARRLVILLYGNSCYSNAGASHAARWVVCCKVPCSFS